VENTYDIFNIIEKKKIVKTNSAMIDTYANDVRIPKRGRGKREYFLIFFWTIEKK